MSTTELCMCRLTASRQMDETLEKLGCSDLIGKITLRWNHRLRTTAGRANYGHRRIELSSAIWEHFTEQQRYQTLVHEVCHIVNRHLNGRNANPHGWRWKMLMVKMGLSPDRCHDLDCQKVGLARKNGRRAKVKVRCNCPDGTLMGQTQYKRMVRATNGVYYRCRKCKGVIRPW
jgi:predicted SprT family Zn-dependent metalloprotease